MSNELKPFDEKATCPKCGHDNVRAVHCSERAYIPTFGAHGDFEKREHLRRTCTRCHFGWNEATVDAAESEPQL